MQRQTESEQRDNVTEVHNTVGFTGADARSATLTAKYFMKHGELPKVKGSDDTEEAMWVPLEKTMSMTTKMYEDHYFIISAFIGKRS